MNLVLLEPEDFVAPGCARIAGRRLQHVREVHRATVGQTLSVGLINGPTGRATVTGLDADALDMDVTLDGEPPAKLPLTLLLALPRPKVLNRSIAAASSLGIERIFLVNAWRVEKSYWSTPRLAPANLRRQAMLGLEQAKDTVLPQIEVRRFFRAFIEQELPSIAAGSRLLVAHPAGAVEAPRAVSERAVLVIGPEGGLIEREVESFAACGAELITLGPRILRVETAIATLVGRLF